MSSAPVAEFALKWSSAVSGQLDTDGDMSQTSITSTPTNCEGLGTLAYQLTWAATGSPAGTFSFEGSNNYNAQASTGTWVAFSSALIVGLSSVHPAGSSGDHLVTIDLSIFKAKYVRVKYTRTSGSGTLTGWVFGS